MHFMVFFVPFIYFIRLIHSRYISVFTCAITVNTGVFLFWFIIIYIGFCVYFRVKIVAELL